MTAPAWPREAAEEIVGVFDLWLDSQRHRMSEGELAEHVETVAKLLAHHAARHAPSGPAANAPQFTFAYRNYKGEVSERHVRPISIRFGATEWHPMPQWLLLAFDLDKQAEREFAMRDMSGLSAPSGPAGAVREALLWARRGLEVAHPIINRPVVEDGIIYRVEKAVQMIDAALAAAPPGVVADGWRPVSEAPSAEWGRPIPMLLWGPRTGVRDGSLHNFKGDIAASIATLHGDAIADWGVTHFMPLPAPPAEPPR